MTCTDFEVNDTGTRRALDVTEVALEQAKELLRTIVVDSAAWGEEHSYRLATEALESLEAISPCEDRSDA